MHICMDIGNTNIVIGIFENNIIINRFRFSTNTLMTADEYGIKIMQLFNYNNINKDLIEGFIISSVVPELDLVIKMMVKKYFGIEPILIGPGIKTGIHIKLDNPKQLGADLLVGAVGVVEKYGANSLIIDIGTALTMVYVNDKKEFSGGSICAGIKGSLKSLINSTSKLSTPTLDVPEKVVCNDTLACIQSGIVFGHISMIEGLVSKIKKELNNDNLKVLLTGGNSIIIKDHLNIDFIYDENLLLEGLLDIYTKNE